MSFHDWLYDLSSNLWPFAANHLWQTTLACCLAMVAISFLNRESARARYAVWMIISLKFVLPSTILVALLGLNGISLNSPAAQMGPLQESEPIGIGFFDIADLPTTEEPGHTHSETYCLLTLVWLAGFALVLTRWLRRRAAFSRLLRSTRVVARHRESAALDRVAGWLRARNDIELIVSPEVVEPGVWGVFRPAIVLPENMSDQLSDPELESVLMHEVTHIRRRDNLVASLQMILCSVFWFHPLIWIIDRKMLADREQACDQEVCLLGGQPAVYAASLLKVVRFCIGFRMAGVSSAAGSNLKRRIEEIMGNEVEERSAPRQRAFVVLVALVVMVFSVAAGVMSRDRFFAEQGSNKQDGVKGGVPRPVAAGSLGDSGTAGDGSQDNLPLHTRYEMRNELTRVTLDEELKTAAEIPLSFDSDYGSPVTITEARMKAVKSSSVYAQQGGDDMVYLGDQYAVNACVTLVNNSYQRIIGISLVFSCDKAGAVGLPPVSLLLEPGATIQTGHREWGGIGDPSSFSVRVGQVLFEGGASWPQFLPDGTVVTGPPLAPPPPPLPGRRRGSQLLIWLPRL